MDKAYGEGQGEYHSHNICFQGFCISSSAPCLGRCVCLPGVGRGGGVGQVGAAPTNQRGEADDEADDPDQADQQLRPGIKMYKIELQTIHCIALVLNFVLSGSGISLQWQW